MHVTISDTNFSVQRSPFVSDVGAPRPMSITFLPNHLRPETELCLFYGSGRDPMSITCTLAEFCLWLEQKQKTPDAVGEGFQ